MSERFISSDRLNIVEEVTKPAAPAKGNGEDAKPDRAPSNSRPTIRLVAGEIERIVDEAEIALIKANRGLYQRDNKIVFVAYSPAKTSTGEDTVTIQILERGEHALIVDMAAAANFERFDKRSKDWVAADPPISIVKALQQHGLGKLRFPILHGVITAPTMRADGSILSCAGIRCRDRSALRSGPSRISGRLQGGRRAPTPREPLRRSARSLRGFLSSIRMTGRLPCQQS